MAEERVVRSDISNRIVPDDQVVKISITFGRPARQPPRELDAAEDEIREWINLSREKARRRGSVRLRRRAVPESDD